MAKTSAERQAAYRARRTVADSAERRLNTWVSSEVYSAIERLAKSYGVTRRAVIELLVSHEDGKPSELNDRKTLPLSDHSGNDVLSLRCNKLGETNDHNPAKPNIDKLPRNTAAEVVNKKREKQSLPAARRKPSLLGGQFELDL